MSRSSLALLLAVVLALLPALMACTTATRAPAGVPESDRESYAAEARWAPGQLEAHFKKHPEGYRSAEEYDRGARETIRQGTSFTYRDRETGESRLGFYDRNGNRFTSLTRDGRRITTHFRPDQGEQYVRRLQESTYR